MADEQQAPKELSFFEKFNAPLDVLWDKYKIFLIVFGVLILMVKFREVLIDILVDSSRKTVSDATKQDAALKGEENKANDQANQLKQEASKLSENKPTVDEDWNKK